MPSHTLICVSKNLAKARNRLGQDSDLVLFGHLHRTFYRLAACACWNRRAALVPAPSLSQLGESVVGFNVYLLLCVNHALWVEVWPFVARLSAATTPQFQLENGMQLRIDLQRSC